MRILTALILTIGAASTQGQVALTQGTNFTVDVASDGRLAMDLLGDIWTLPAAGGQARPVVAGDALAHRPRWAPDSGSIVYQLRSESQEQLWLYNLAKDVSINISDGHYFDQHPFWHPGGERIVYSSDRGDSGFDLWELDLPTRLTWRISSMPGDETEPAWSSDGRDLIYIHVDDGRWSLMLRRLGEPDRVLETSATRLSAPAWRPDGSLVTFVRHAAEGLSIDMVILADPLLVRPLISDEDFFVSPVAWRNRRQLLYTANGAIRTRNFNSWTSRNLPFRAMVQREQSARWKPPPQRDLPAVGPPAGKLVLRTARLYDGIAGGYREGTDIVMDGGRIAAIEQQQERAGTIVVDMGDLTALPGYIDAHASLPATIDDTLGPVLLSFGVTTIVAGHADAERLNQLWSGKELPGPRVLGAEWAVDLEPLSSMVLGTDSLPVSPAGIRYENVQITASEEPAMILSGLADARTAGLRDLLYSRQASLIGDYPTAIRRFSAKPQLDALSPEIVLGSKSNGLPPGIAVHAELRALVEAGLSEERVLRSTGINAASALGLGLRIGRIAPGAAADIVIVDGDPLTNISDAQNVVGIVRNGRFYSAIGLIERAEIAKNVE